MSLYNYHYFVSQNSWQKYIGFEFAFVLVLFLIFFIYKYWRDRTRVKYRDLVTIFALLIIFILGTQISNFEQVRTISNQTNQTSAFIRQVAKDEKTDHSKIYVNSTSIKNGMLMKIHGEFYRVSFDDSYNSYRLSKVNLVSHDVNYVR